MKKLTLILFFTISYGLLRTFIFAFLLALTFSLTLTLTLGYESANLRLLIN